MKKILLLIGLCLAAQPVSAATILAYHHVSSETPRSTSLSISEFEQHLALIEELKLEVVGIDTIVETIRAGKSVPDNWTALTFDDGYASVYHNAWPILKAKKLPFSVFINPDMVKPSKLYMSWEQLKELSDNGVLIANHTLKHENLIKDGLSNEQIIDNLNQAEQQIVDQLGQNHKFLAYPFGEYDDNVRAILKRLGYAGFVQHSGAVDQHTDITAITRFPAAGIYANPKTLRNKINSLAFSMASITPTDTKPTSSQPKVTVELNQRDYYNSQVQCFISGIGAPQKVTWLNELSFEIASPEAIGKGRIKYNCTAPSKSKPGRFYWFSKLWIND